jgi:hypothetical protein
MVPERLYLVRITGLLDYIVRYATPLAVHVRGLTDIMYGVLRSETNAGGEGTT